MFQNFIDSQDLNRQC